MLLSDLENKLQLEAETSIEYKLFASRNQTHLHKGEHISWNTHTNRVEGMRFKLDTRNVFPDREKLRQAFYLPLCLTILPLCTKLLPSGRKSA